MRQIAVGVIVIMLLASGLCSELVESPGIEMQMKRSLAQANYNGISNALEGQPAQNEFQDEFTPKGEHKSPSRAFLLSLLLPGAGQYYNESKTKAKIFAGTEASLWVGFLAFRQVGKWKRNDYHSYAVAHADVNPQGKDDQFYEHLTYYSDRDEYNQLTRLYNGPSAPVYPETDYWDWEWDSHDSRSHYRDLRNQSKTAFRRSLYMVGISALNRLVAGIDAFRGAKKFNRKKSMEEEISFHPQISLFGHNRRIGVLATKIF